MKNRLGLFVLYYLRFFARLQLAKLKLLNSDLKIVGITASAGKTSCLLACEAALSPNFRIRTNYGGNSESGIPLSLLGLHLSSYSLADWLSVLILAPFCLISNWKTYDIILLEMGIDSPRSPKNMDYLLSIVRPNIGIFLNVSSVHLHNFKNIDSLACEKAKLISATAIGIINSADLLVKKYSSNKKLISLKPVNVSISDHVLPPIYNITFGAVFELAKIFKLSPTQTKQNLIKNFHLPPGRSSFLKGILRSQIIDSSYNSSPLACREMLKLLSTFSSPRIAVLGDMRELGPNTSIDHRHIYQIASKSSDLLISVGPETQKFFGAKAVKFLYWWQALDYLKIYPELVEGSTILVKGSQNTIFLEELVKGLLKNQSDISKLCRQSNYWIQLKNHFRQSHQFE